MTAALIPTTADHGLVVDRRPSLFDMPWQNALGMWLPKLDSEQTRRTYGRQVRLFFGVEGVPQALPFLTVDVLDAYAGALRYRANRGAEAAARLAPGTVNLKLAALHSFLTFCRKRKWLDDDLREEAIADALKPVRAKVQRPYQIVERGEFASLLDAAAADDWDAPRAVALVALGLGAGLRVAELIALSVGDLRSDVGGHYIDVREGKGRKDRQVPISEEVYQYALTYLDASGRALHRSADRTAPLFGIGVRQAERVVKACARRAGLLDDGRSITPHALRHSFAIHVLLGDAEAGQAPAPLPAVSKLLGHSGVAVTGRYLDHLERHNLAQYAPKLRRTEP